MYTSAKYVGPSQHNLGRAIAHARVQPPDWGELAFYSLTLYAIMCTVWHIYFPLLGAAGFAALAAVCATRVVSHSAPVRRALMLPVLCGVSLIAVQLIFHGETLKSDFVRPFAIWMLSLVVVQSLALRPGFLHRFALVSLGIGLLTLPYTRLVRDSGAFRLALDRRVGFSNPNDLGAWFGFCCVYFITVGVETRRLSMRIVSAVGVIISLTLLGLTVSRGPLISAAVATVIAYRRVLRRGFVPVLILVAGVALAYGAGVFDKIVEYYTARSLVESGRLVAWPRILQRCLDFPFVGVGIHNVATFVPEQGMEITPHNSYLFFYLSSGVVPFLFFIAYLVRAAWRSVFCQDHPELRADQPFRLPLLVYIALSCVSLDYNFMANWAVVGLCMAMSVVEPKSLIRSPRLQPGDQRRFEPRYV